MSNVKVTFTLENLQMKMKLPCKKCSSETSHSVVSSYLESGSEDVGGGNSVDWTERNQIVQCLGCDSVSFRVCSTCSEDCDYDESGSYLNETIKFYPGRTEGLKAINSYLLPDNVRSIYEETILAIENEQNVLAGIGVRALIETICKDLEVHGKALYDRINALQDKGVVTSEGITTLHKLRVLGNDAAHEVKTHSTQQLSLAVQIIEHMLDGTYIIPHKVAQVFK